MSYTGSLVHFFNSHLYLRDEVAINVLVSMYKDCLDVEDPSARGLVPFDYGLIVLDFDTSSILDMQCGRDLWFSAALFATFDLTAQYHLDSGRLGWMGKDLVSMTDDVSLARFDQAIFASWADLTQWCEGQQASLRASRAVAAPGVAQGFCASQIVVPGFRLKPAGWTMKSFRLEESAGMLASMNEVGITCDEREAERWSAWETSHRDDRDGNVSV